MNLLVGGVRAYRELVPLASSALFAGEPQEL